MSAQSQAVHRTPAGSQTLGRLRLRGGLKRGFYSVDGNLDIEVVLLQNFSDVLDQTVFFKCVSGLAWRY
ncbi:hypothetical protein [Corynebacterium belfantii]|uniref:hypothetical protein n=1 Tax=Corynebacterium belfantii TaxID=2014537 RepID=UPI00248BE94D|nr:hypothetical protein [Corynebacterium belfantii]